MLQFVQLMLNSKKESGRKRAETLKDKEAKARQRGEKCHCSVLTSGWTGGGEKGEEGE